MKQYKINNICDLNLNTLCSDDTFETICYLDTGNITNNEMNELQKFSIKNAPSRAQRKVKDKTIIYSTVRPNLRHFGILDNPSENFIVSTGFTTIDLKDEYKEEIDPMFLYYKLSQKEITAYLHCIAENSVSSYPSINPSDIENLTFEFPEYEEQCVISSVLASIDTKIKLNKQINHKLEAIAKELYNYWFVQFDFPDKKGKPYRASGGKMVYNDLLKRKIPKGWEVSPIGSVVASNVNGDWGEDNKTKEYSLKVNCIRGADITTLTKLPMRYININNKNKLLNEGDIVIEISGGSPTQSTGRSILITNGLLSRYNSNLICSNFCQSLRLKNKQMSPYFLCMWNMFYNNNIMFNYEGKTSGIKNFLIDSFLKNLWVFPNDQIIENFNEYFVQNINLIDKHIEENLQLSKLRDYLLPLLMNGQITVCDAEKTVDNVISFNQIDNYDQKYDKWIQNQGIAARGEKDKQTKREIFDLMDDDDK